MRPVLAILIVSGAPLGHSTASARAGSAPVVTLRPDGLAVEWNAPSANIGAQADGTARVTLPGFATLDRPGLPQAPFASALIALPPNAQPSVEVEQAEEHTIALPGPLASAPQPDGVQRDMQGNVIGGAYAPAEARPFNPAVIELEPLGLVRGVRLARLVFYPVRLVNDEWRLATHVRAVVRFNAPDRLARAAASPDTIMEALQSAVLNPSQLQTLPARPPPANLIAASNPPTALIDVSQTGLTAITYEALTAAGFPSASTNPQNLRLTRRTGAVAANIAYAWEGDADTTFEPGERLLFFAEPRFNRYTVNDVYFVSADTTPGLRMSTRAALPGALPPGAGWMDQRVETNALYTPTCYCGSIPGGRDSDHWTWDVLRLPDRSSITLTVNLPTVNTAQPATLTAWYIGYTDVPAAPDHRVRATLNGNILGQTEWNGKQAITATLAIPAGVLQNGNNTLNLSLPGIAGAVEGAWLDAFAIRYARGSAATGATATFTGEAAARSYTLALSSGTGLRAYDVTTPTQPVSLTVTVAGNSVSLGDTASGPRRYAVTSASSILSPVSVRMITPLQNISGASYLIITPSAFSSALSTLTALRQTQGLSVAVENVQAIYDAHEGRPTPEAIRAYLATAYANWSPRPTYVLLVGDGTYDPKRYRPESFQTFIPPYLADVDPWAGETATDNRYVTVVGNDALPDMLIGRLPVNSLAEAQTVVNKIVSYETQPRVGLWNSVVTFASDNPDGGGDFPAQSQLLAATYITTPFTSLLINLPAPPTPITSARQALLSRWNAGTGVLMFTGHSSVHQWAAERLFHLDDVTGLTNGPFLPVVLEMTCFTGAFHEPGYATLDEALVRSANGGAVAVWGATGLGVAHGHDVLSNGFLHSLYNLNRRELGRAILDGKIDLAANGVAPDLLDTYTLLGDPAMRVNLTIDPGFPVYLPVIRR